MLEDAGGFPVAEVCRFGVCTGWVAGGFALNGNRVGRVSDSRGTKNTPLSTGLFGPAGLDFFALVDSFGERYRERI